MLLSQQKMVTPNFVYLFVVTILLLIECLGVLYGYYEGETLQNV